MLCRTSGLSSANTSDLRCTQKALSLNHKNSALYFSKVFLFHAVDVAVENLLYTECEVCGCIGLWLMLIKIF